MIDINIFNEALNILPGEKRELINSILIELVNIDNRLDSIRDKDFIKVNKECPSMMKETSYSKLYIKLLQQKTLLIKTINSILRNTTEDEEENPLKDFKKEFETYFNKG